MGTTNNTTPPKPPVKRYRATRTVVYDNKPFEAGKVLPEALSAEDIKALLEIGAIEPAGKAGADSAEGQEVT